MPDSSPGAEAGAGAEALLGLAAGRQVRLPSVSSLPDATKSTPAPVPPLHPAPQPRSFLPTPPPLQLPDQTTTPPPIRHLPPPGATLLQQPTERLPTISEWAQMPLSALPHPQLHPLHSSDRLAERFQPPSSLSAPFAYAHPAPQWSTQPRSLHYQQQPAQPYIYYPNGQTLPSPSSLNPPAVQPTMNPLPPPLALSALQMPRSDASQSLPTVAPFPTIDRLCEPTIAPTASANAAAQSSASLPSLKPSHDAQADPNPSVSAQHNSAQHNSAHSLDARPPAGDVHLRTPEVKTQPGTPPSRARGLADLINPTDSPPGNGGAPPLVLVDVSKPAQELPKVRLAAAAPLAPSAPLAPLPIHPLSSSVPSFSMDLSHPSSKSSTKLGSAAKREMTAFGPEHGSMSSRLVMEVQPAYSGEVGMGATAVTSQMSARGTVRDATNELSATSVGKKEEPVLRGEQQPPADDESSESEVTRCPCGSALSSGFMIACDECNTWQHSRCMGYRRRADVPEKYYCHICRPDLLRTNCIAHPRYKEKMARERDGKESKRDIEATLSAVKPVELRRVFVYDIKHKKSTLKAGKDQIVLKYAGLMRSSFAKHRQSVVEGLMVLLDLSRAEASEKLEGALRKLRNGSNEKLDETVEKKRSGVGSPLDGTSSDVTPKSAGTSRSAHKRQRSSLTLETVEDPNGPRPENGSVDIPGDVDMNDNAGNRMSREERKLRETMRLFARMEERERDKKRPRTGESTNSPRSGQHSRPKTPRSATHTPASSSKPGTPRGLPDLDVGKGRAFVERKNGDVVDSRPAHADQVEPHAMRNDFRDDDADSPDKRERFENGKSSQRLAGQSSKSHGEVARETSRRERHRSERGGTRRRDGGDGATMSGHKRTSMLERTRSHEAKRRRTLGKDVRGKEASRRNTPPVPSISLPGPSLLGSSLIPSSRLAQLEREAREEEQSTAQVMKSGTHSDPPRKDTSTRRDFLPWRLRLAEATPTKKRYLDAAVSTSDLSETTSSIDDELSHQKMSVNMVVVSKKEALPDHGNKLETSLPIVRGDERVDGKECKEFCLKKRPGMFPGAVKKETQLGAANDMPANQVSSDSSIKTEATPKVEKKLLTGNGIFQSASISPRLRSSPVAVVRTPLRSAPLPSVKRVRSPVPRTMGVGGAKREEKSVTATGAVNGGSGGNVAGLRDTAVSPVVSSVAGTTKIEVATLSPTCSAKVPHLDASGKGVEQTKQPATGEGKSDEGKRMSPDGDTLKGPTMGGNATGAGVVGEGMKRPVMIPLSKPIGALVGTGSGIMAPGSAKKSTPALGSIGIRSMPVSAAMSRNNADGAKKVGIVGETNGTAFPHKAADILEPQDSGSGSISDFLQQRLLALSKESKGGPTASEAGKTNGAVIVATTGGAGTGVRNGSIEQVRHASGGRGFTANGVLRSAPANVASYGKNNSTMDGKRGGWGGGELPSFAGMNKRGHGGYYAGRLNMASASGNGGGGVTKDGDGPKCGAWSGGSYVHNHGRGDGAVTGSAGGVNVNGGFNGGVNGGMKGGINGSRPYRRRRQDS